jgi:hypothetical protein
MPIMLQPAASDTWLQLRLLEIEKVFVQVAIDLKEILVLDGIDQLSDPSRFRIRSNDLFGPLPEIIIQGTGDRDPVLDKIQNEAAKLIAIVRVRKDLAGMYPECEFLLPTSIEEGAPIGMWFGGKTILAEEKNHWEAYHKLVREAVSKLL